MTDVQGKVTGWNMGHVGPDVWATLTVEMGPFAGVATMSSRHARAFAIDVLTDQGPYLGFQPPNDGMKEQRSSPAFGSNRRGEPPWRERGRVRDLARQLAELREDAGDDVFFAAVGRVSGEVLA